LMLLMLLVRWRSAGRRRKLVLLLFQQVRRQFVEGPSFVFLW